MSSLWTRVVELYIVRQLVFKTRLTHTHKKNNMCYNGSGQCNQYKHHCKLNNWHNWEGLFKQLKRMRIFTLTLYNSQMSCHLHFCNLKYNLHDYLQLLTRWEISRSDPISTAKVVCDLAIGRHTLILSLKFWDTIPGPCWQSQSWRIIRLASTT